MKIQRCYELLELKSDASLDEARQAYRDISYVWHPDRFSHNYRIKKKAEEKLKEINEAYELLTYHLSSGKGSLEDTVLSENDSGGERKDRIINKGFPIEEFVGAGTFIALKAWSTLSSSLIRFLRNQINEKDTK